MTKPSIYDFSAKDITGKDVSLSQWKGKVLVVVNVASQCGFTPQYAGLEQLWKEHKGEVVVLGFPCNQFGHQEPGAEEEIKGFCDLNYGVTFPLFSKVEVNGEGAHPVWKFLKESKKGLLGTEAIKWNFTKFLVDRQGQVVKRFAPTDTPEKMKKDVAALL